MRADAPDPGPAARETGGTVSAGFAAFRSIPAPIPEKVMPLVLAILVALALPASVSASLQDGPTITVSAASDLRFAFEEIGEAFEAETGIGVDFNFGSTGQLAQQIESGAPVDVFAAANVSYIESLAAEDLVIEDTRTLYARGQIVLWTRADSSLEVTTIDRLADDDIGRIAIANPDHAPYGTATREALVSAGIWDEVQDKLVLGENISDTLRYGETGNVDVAIVALSLAIPGDGTWTIVPQELYPPLDQEMAVIAETPHEEEARAFVAFVNSESGRETMREYGFLLPGEDMGTPVPAASPAT
jgi:molybdate transport system substrate-binding protein